MLVSSGAILPSHRATDDPRDRRAGLEISVKLARVQTRREIRIDG